MEAVLAQSSAPTSSFAPRSAFKGCSEILEPTYHSAFLSGAPLRRCPLRVTQNNPHKRGVLLVQASKGKRRFVPGMPQQRPGPTLPKFDEDDNPKFVIFVRDKRVPLWFPLSIVTGGTVAKMMVSAMSNEFGKNISQSTLTRNIGAAVYKDEKSIRITATKNYSVLKTATDLEYGYKIVNKDNPRAALTTSNVIKIPPQEELKSVVDKVRDFFGQGVTGLKDSFGSLSSLNFGAQDEVSRVSEQDSKSK